MLIDWEMAGAGRAFEIRVPDVLEAKSFYRKALGARETSRQEARNGEPFELGLAIGRVQFTVSSEAGAGLDRPLLSALAADLGAPFIAIILHVENPDLVAYEAEKNGATVSIPPEAHDLTVVTDPFGSHWVLMKRRPADDGVLSPHGRITRH